MAWSMKWQPMTDGRAWHSINKSLDAGQLIPVSCASHGRTGARSNWLSLLCRSHFDPFVSRVKLNTHNIRRLYLQIFNRAFVFTFGSIALHCINCMSNILYVWSCNTHRGASALSSYSYTHTFCWVINIQSRFQLNSIRCSKMSDTRHLYGDVNRKARWISTSGAGWVNLNSAKLTHVWHFSD